MNLSFKTYFHRNEFNRNQKFYIITLKSKYKYKERINFELIYFRITIFTVIQILNNYLQ